MIALDPTRINRRAKALAELRQHATVYYDRCERQGWSPDTAPVDLARHEIAHEMTAELLTGAP